MVVGGGGGGGGGVTSINPTALRMATTLWNFDHSECDRVNLVLSRALIM